jgi:hypothetical protein
MDYIGLSLPVQSFKIYMGRRFQVIYITVKIQLFT